MKNSKICPYDGHEAIWLLNNPGSTLADARKVFLEKNGHPKFTCPECGRRLKPRIYECHDPGCWHASIPKGHKRKKWWKKGKKNG